jgi:pyruvyl transferase EpsO
MSIVSHIDPMNEVWRCDLDSLKSMHKKIYEEIGMGKKIAYLDFPMHFNVGDLLIFKGTEQFFKEYDIDVIYRENKTKFVVNYYAINKADVIVFHGGGNFGDIYPKFQKYRERIIKRFPEKKIIILPQTIYFKDEKNLEISAKILSSHKNLLLYVRDKESHEMAKKYAINVKLMPDMAHSLHPLKDSSEVGHSNKVPVRILNLQRVDCEKSDDNDNTTIKKKSFDWRDLITVSDKVIYTVCKVMVKVPILRNYFISVYAKISDDVVFKSISYFDQHEVVHTDRLHGFILSVLLGKSIVLKDNSYGKNTRYKSAWLDKYPFLLKK